MPAGTTTDPTTAPATPETSGRRPGTAVSLGVAAALGGVLPLASASAAQASTWTVRSGDTLSAIAARTGTSVPALAAANGLRDPGRLSVGQRIALPPAPSAVRTATAVVRPGDTVTAIAARAGLPVAAVLSANGLGARTVIRPGQVLVLPGRTAAPTTAPAATTPAGAQPVASTFAGRAYASTVTAAATANRQALGARPQPGRDAVRQLVADTARAMGVDPALALAVAHQESGFDMHAVSPANAVGVMQVIPSSGRWASSLVGRPLDLLDARDNVVAGVAILRSLTSAAADTPTAIAGYYQGLAGVVRNGMYPDTRRYVANVQTLMGRYR